jgi:drug/metabolite transporter (DMT)-like permease
MGLSLVTGLVAALIGLAFIALGGGTVLSGSGNLTGGALGALAGAVYVLPILFLTLWSAQRLSPAVISFLLTAEILSGVLSGALFLDEPFGPMQAAGAVMVLMAAAVEVIPALRGKAA